MGKNKKSLNEQLDICRRRIDGHSHKVDSKGNCTGVPRNKNSNPDRYYRLLVRLSELENIFRPQPQRSGRRPQNDKRSNSKESASNRKP